MKDENIKEILDKLKDSVNYPMIDVPTMDGTDSEPMENTVLLEPNESKLLLDYITNLQEENRQAKLLKERYQLEKEIYKLRNEKALEINQKLQNMYILDSRAIFWLSQQEKVLQGDDKDVKD